MDPIIGNSFTETQEAITTIVELYEKFKLIKI